MTKRYPSPKAKMFFGENESKKWLFWLVGVCVVLLITAISSLYAKVDSVEKKHNADIATVTDKQHCLEVDVKSQLSIINTNVIAIKDDVKEIKQDLKK